MKPISKPILHEIVFSIELLMGNSKKIFLNTQSFLLDTENKMDELTKAFFDARFEANFHRLKGLAFQDFFSEIMGKRYLEDFIRVRPWGNIGDRKCDGYLPSKRILFQVYAPNELSAIDTITKIDEDFNEAIPYWRDYFDTWIFVHNSRDGLGPDVTKKLLSLTNKSKPVTIGQWGFEELRLEVLQLNESQLSEVLGYAPSNRAMNGLRFEHIREVLINVSRQEPSQNIDIRPVPGEKIKHNLLSSNVEIMLSSGMRKANLVREFFQTHIDPRYGDIVAADFKKIYGHLRTTTIDPDEIFYELQKYAAGEIRSTPSIECAALAVLAYLFEECEIFERPPEVIEY